TNSDNFVAETATDGSLTLSGAITGDFNNQDYMAAHGTVEISSAIGGAFDNTGYLSSDSGNLTIDGTSIGSFDNHSVSGSSGQIFADNLLTISAKIDGDFVNEAGGTFNVGAIDIDSSVDQSFENDGQVLINGPDVNTIATPVTTSLIDVAVTGTGSFDISGGAIVDFQQSFNQGIT